MRRAYAHKVDANQAQILDACRAVGASVLNLSALGNDCPDALIGYRVNTLLEIKSNGGKVTPGQVAFHHKWRGTPVVVVRTVDEALIAIGAQKGNHEGNVDKS